MYERSLSLLGTGMLRWVSSWFWGSVCFCVSFYFLSSMFLDVRVSIPSAPPFCDCVRCACTLAPAIGMVSVQSWNFISLSSCGSVCLCFMVGLLLSAFILYSSLFCLHFVPGFLLFQCRTFMREVTSIFLCPLCFLFITSFPLIYTQTCTKLCSQTGPRNRPPCIRRAQRKTTQVSGIRSRYLSDKEEGVQGQVFNVVWNLADNEEDVSMAFQGISPQVLLHYMTTSLKSTDRAQGPSHSPCSLFLSTLYMTRYRWHTPSRSSRTGTRWSSRRSSRSCLGPINSVEDFQPGRLQGRVYSLRTEYDD